MHIRFVGVVVLVFVLASSGRAQDVPEISPMPLRRIATVDLQADQLIFDTGGNRVIAQGDVEIHYNKHILTADRVTYNRGPNTLVAEGNTRFTDSSGHITRADRFEVPDDFRDAFVQSLNMTIEDTR